MPLPRNNLATVVVAGFTAAMLMTHACGDGGENDEPAKPCPRACTHIIQCRLDDYPNSALQDPVFASLAACVASCEAEGPLAEVICAADNTDCATLDDVCNVF